MMIAILKRFTLGNIANLIVMLAIDIAVLGVAEIIYAKNFSLGMLELIDHNDLATKIVFLIIIDFILQGMRLFFSREKTQ